jgi:cysteine desulfurase/selenocysteine lyase
MFDPVEIRKHFPIYERFQRENIVYLDNAATTQKPKEVIDAIVNYYENSNSNVHRGVYRIGEEATDLYNKSRENIAGFTGGKPEGTIFVRNATEALNLAANSLTRMIGKKFEVLVSRMEHHSNIVPWQIASDTFGIRLKMMESNIDRPLSWGDIERNITKDTRIVSLTHVSNLLGTINDLREIGKNLHERGIYFIVDAAQSVPHMPVNFRDLNCDLMAFSGHKMLGPSGIGVLQGTPEILEDMPPYMGGGEMIKEVFEDHFIAADIPEKFEAGTPNIEGAIGLSAAVNFLKNLRMESIRQHEKDLIAYTLEKEDELNIPSLISYGPRDPEVRGGIYSFNMRKNVESERPFGNEVHPHDISHLADRIEGVEVRSGHHCAMPQTVSLGVYATARASFYIYNTREDVDHLFDAIEKIGKRMIK